jgi:hypothetical protein
VSYSSGTFDFAADAPSSGTLAGGPNLTVASDAVLNFNATQHLAGLTIHGQANMGSGGGHRVLVTGAFAIDPAGRFDLADHAMIVDYIGASPLTGISASILLGRGAAGFGNATWAGNGIRSSSAATDPDGYAVGYAENADLPLGSYATWEGENVDDTSILVKYTRNGDADLDGVVGDNDVTIVGAFYQDPSRHDWYFGDFDYSGSTDDSDVTLLGAFYDPSAPPI